MDLVEVLRERHCENEDALEGLTRDSIAEIHLFFDYDGHSVSASDDVITKMLKHFNEETEHGKLYDYCPTKRHYYQSAMGFEIKPAYCVIYEV